MRFGRRGVHAIFLLALPIVVAVFGVSVSGAVALVAVMALWRWVLTLTALTSRYDGPELVLETISASHFVEKVRWALDRLGVAYDERPNVGVLGVFFLGRTVPVLHIRTGVVHSSIGDSPAILRYLWGAYGRRFPDRAAFLAPSDAAVELEADLDRYGRWMQRWIYYHLLPNRRLTLHAWGVNDPRLPAWQRVSVWCLFPILKVFMSRAFQLDDAGHERNKKKIEALHERLEALLKEDARSLLGGRQRSFVDYAAAALSALWIMPDEYGGGRAEAVRFDTMTLPSGMTEEISAWRDENPNLTAFVERLYRVERRPARAG